MTRKYIRRCFSVIRARSFIHVVGSSVSATSATAVSVSSAAEKEVALRTWFQSHAPVLVAFSGGVDSAYLGFLAASELGPAALCVTAVSPSLASVEKEELTRFVTQYGLSHRFVETREMDRAEYRANAPDRCYFCKSELFDTLGPIAAAEGIDTVCDGTNADDAADIRPGRRAGRERGVASPLLELGFTKADIRERSRHWGLPTAEKPAAPCLASRIPYGTPVTIERLSVVERGERALRDLGFVEFRLRHHGDTARIEISRAELVRALDQSMADTIVARLKPLGFTFIALDLEGFRSGALNQSSPDAGGRNTG